MTATRFAKLSVFILLTSLLLIAGVAGAAGPKVTHFTGMEFLPSLAECEAAGGWMGDDHCLLAETPPTITPNGKHLEAWHVSYWRDESTDPRYMGYTTVDANLFLNLAIGHARIWGTWRHDVDRPLDSGWVEDTGWEGTWNASSAGFLIARAQGTGSFAGMILHTKRYLETGVIEGTIVE
jgi:hypothetical protein